MEDINWEGGQIEVTKGISGWTVTQRTADGKIFDLDWTKHKVDAVRVAKGMAARRNAKLLVEA